ncbi:MAG: CoA transferase [Actinomycetales bacterium]|nr:CoA transferase [Actinomycetales bacterium]
MSAPLAGVVVVSLEAAISVPFATRQLCDLGATVIKVERPEGDFARHYDDVMAGESAFFAWANRGKQSIRLDVKDDQDLATLRGLIAGADVFVHNLSPRAAQRLGVDAASLAEQYPHLIAAEVSGYGLGGPRTDDKAYDLAIQAEAGVFSLNGDGGMSKVGFSVADICSGMYALSSILAALVRRERTGAGAAVHVSMLDSLAEWVSAPLYNAVYGPGQPTPTSRRHHAIAPYGTFTLADGSTVLIAVQSDGEWRSLAEQLLLDAQLADDPRFATNAQRIANVDALEAIIQSTLSGMAADQARGRLAAGRIATAEVNDLRGVWEHEQLRARHRFIEAGSPSGPLEMLAAPFDISGWAPPAGRIPALDEHDPATIEAVIQRGISTTSAGRAHADRGRPG